MSGEEKKFYVYALLDPRKPGEYRYEGLDFTFDFEPFYVGKGAGNRWKRHYEPIAGSTNAYKFNIINKLKSLVLPKLHTKIFLSNNEQEALDLEELCINYIGKRANKLGPLTNLSDGGLTSAGYKHTEESKEKMVLGKVGRVMSEEWCSNISKANLGKIITTECKEKMSKAAKGKIVSEETKAKMSESAKVKIFTDEHRKNISIAGTGRVASEESKQRMSVAQTGKFVSEAARENMSKGQMGRVHSDETKAKLSASRLGVTFTEERKALMRGRVFSDEHKEKIINTNRDVRVKYRHVVLLPSGESVVVYQLGRFCIKSGIGKKTSDLIKTFSGLLKKTKGHILLERTLLPTNWREIYPFKEEYEEENAKYGKE